MDAHTLIETDPHGGGVGGDKGEGDVEEYVEEDGDGVAEHEDGEEGEVNPALKKQLEQLGVHLSFSSLGRDQVFLPVKCLCIRNESNRGIVYVLCVCVCVHMYSRCVHIFSWVCTSSFKTLGRDQSCLEPTNGARLYVYEEYYKEKVFTCVCVRACVCVCVFMCVCLYVGVQTPFESLGCDQKSVFL